MSHRTSYGNDALRMCTAALLSAFAAASVTHAADEPVVAAAASLRNALDEIGAAFEKETGSKVRFSYGATGNLVRQIEEGAPFELFLAADEASVKKLADGGKTEGAPSVLVRGRLAVAAPKASLVAVDGNLEGLKAALAEGKVRHVAIANPELAPYGRAAREALKRAGLWEKVEPLLVVGENVAQAAQFVASGAADAGLIARSLTLAPDFVAVANVAVVPEDWHAPVIQGMALLKGAGATARSFQDFLKSRTARALFEKHGFVVP